jgi:hypothetical protein
MSAEEFDEFDEDDAWYSDDPEEKEKEPFRSKINAFVPIAALVIAASFFLPTTIGGLITLGSGNKVEFGQSSNLTVSCSGSTDINVLPAATFVNVGSATGTHYLNSIKVSNVPTSCNGVDFLVSVYDNSSSSPLALASRSPSLVKVYSSSNSLFKLDPFARETVTSGTGSFTVTFSDPIAVASTTIKFALQSSAHSPFCNETSSGCIGKTGPAGGTIIYQTSTPFLCGPARADLCKYLEAAPYRWNSGNADNLTARTWAQSPLQSTSVSNATSPETATAQAIGWGHRNTNAIILQGNSSTANSAAAFAANHSVSYNGITYDDWFLPSYAELWELIVNAKAAGLTAGTYWSSSESAFDRALNYAVSATWIGAPGSNGKSNGAPYVRPIRAF